MRLIMPNNYCPCGSGQKYKKCCMPKLNLPEDRLSIPMLAETLKESALVDSQIQFFDEERKQTNDDLMLHICELKKCYVRGIIAFKDLRKVLTINDPLSAYLDDNEFYLLAIEAASQFIAQINLLKEEEFCAIHEALDGISKLQIVLPKGDTSKANKESIQ